MPRKRSDPAAEILSYFRTQPLAVAQLVLSLATSAVRERTPAIEKKKVVRRRKPTTPAEMEALANRQLGLTPAPKGGPVPTPRKRRMRAGSQPPVSEATPIVPAVEGANHAD
jgi:hypothetical protein